MKKITIRKILPQKRYRLLFLFLPLFIFVGLFYFFILRDLPSPTRLSSATLPQSTKIYDRNHQLLYTIYADKNQSFTPLIVSLLISSTPQLLLRIRISTTMVRLTSAGLCGLPMPQSLKRPSGGLNPHPATGQNKPPDT